MKSLLLAAIALLVANLGFNVWTYREAERRRAESSARLAAWREENRKRDAELQAQLNEQGAKLHERYKNNIAALADETQRLVLQREIDRILYRLDNPPPQ